MARVTLPKPSAVDVSLAAGIPILAYSEWLFGTKVLGLPAIALPIAGGITIGLALFVPFFLDSYVVTAMRRGGTDVGWALALVLASVVGGSVAHLYELPKEAKVVASGVFGVIVGIVIWRVKKMQHSDSPEIAAARAAGEELQRVKAELRAVRSEAAGTRVDLAASRAALVEQGQAQAAAAEEHAAARHELELEIAGLRARLDTVQEAGASVVPLRRTGQPVKTRSASAAELLAVIRPHVAKGDGRPTIEAALRGRGLACGSDRLRDLIAEAKAAQAEARGVDDLDGAESHDGQAETAAEDGPGLADVVDDARDDAVDDELAVISS